MRRRPAFIGVPDLPISERERICLGTGAAID
jgi:hypothetical protein